MGGLWWAAQPDPLCTRGDVALTDGIFLSCVCPPTSQAAALKMVTFKVQIPLLCLEHWKPQKGEAAGEVGATTGR